jgi:hypothetical protein
MLILSIKEQTKSEMIQPETIDVIVGTIAKYFHQKNILIGFIHNWKNDKKSIYTNIHYKGVTTNDKKGKYVILIAILENNFRYLFLFKTSL